MSTFSEYQPTHNRDGVRGPKGRLEIRVGKGLSDPSRRPTPKGGVWKGGNANKCPKEANKGREEGSAKGLTLKPKKKNQVTRPPRFLAQRQKNTFLVGFALSDPYCLSQGGVLLRRLSEGGWGVGFE